MHIYLKKPTHNMFSMYEIETKAKTCFSISINALHLFRCILSANYIKKAFERWEIFVLIEKCAFLSILYIENTL